MHTHFLAYYRWRSCHLFGSKRECFDSLGKQWLFDVSIRRSSTPAQGWGGTFWASVEKRVFSNRILLKVISLVEWISNCVCLQTLVGCSGLAENTIRMEICVGFLTRWQNLTVNKERGSVGKVGMEWLWEKAGKADSPRLCQPSNVTGVII